MIRELPVRGFSAPFPVHRSKPEAPVDAHDPQLEAIYVRSNNFHTGPHSLDEIERALASNRVSPANRAWHKSLQDWTPLSALLAGLENGSQRSPSEEELAAEVYRQTTAIFSVAANNLLGIFRTALSPSALEDRQEAWFEALLTCVCQSSSFHQDCSATLADLIRCRTPLQDTKQKTSDWLYLNVRSQGFQAVDEIRRTFVHEARRDVASREQWFRRYLNALYKVPPPLVNTVGSLCFGVPKESAEQKACIRACGTKCEEIVAEAVSLLDDHPYRRAIVAQKQRKSRQKQRSLTLLVIVVLSILTLMGYALLVASR